MESPLVSFVIPCFNESPELIDRALLSIRDQTLQDFECIIVDDSTSATTQVALRSASRIDSRFLYIHNNTRAGLANSLNIGMRHARGKFIARFDSDDFCHPQRLAAQVAFLSQNSSVDVLGSAMYIQEPQKRQLKLRKYPETHSEIERRFVFANAVAHPTVMFRASTVRNEAIAYNQEFLQCEDLELWLRLLRKGIRFANLPDPLVTYLREEPARSSVNWQFNKMARIQHLSTPYIIRKCAFIALLSLWSQLPRSLQNKVYTICLE